MTNAADRRSVWLRWLHRIGYVTTALVTAFGLFFGYLWLGFSAPDWPGETAERPLDEVWEEWGDYGASAVLDSLPKREAMAGSGLRLVIMPSFSDWFGLAIYRTSDGRAAGVLSRQQQGQWNPSDPDKPIPPVEIRRIAFVIPSAEYYHFLGWFDDWLKEHRDEDRVPCLDGAPIAFERLNGGAVVSGMGNCEEHFTLLGQRALALVKRQVPSAKLPADPGWHEWKDE